MNRSLDWIPDMHNVPANQQLLACAAVIFAFAICMMIARATKKS